MGLEQAGHHIILQCESDPGAQQVLKRKFPGVLLVPDVCGLEALPRNTEVLAAGFPCIDISKAGLKKGLEGQVSEILEGMEQSGTCEDQECKQTQKHSQKQ